MLTGSSYSPTDFTFFESDTISFEKIYDVLTGKLPGCLFRGVIGQKACEKIYQNFLTNRYTRSRTDGVPGVYLGTYHYKKILDNYLDEAKIYNKILPQIFEGTDNIFSALMKGVSNELNKHGQLAKVASHNHYSACPYFLRKWQGSSQKNFALSPHDDQSQCTFNQQKGFEIQDTDKSQAVTALNLCLHNHGSAELHYWNIQPDQSTKEQLGIEETGYPYPEERLQGIEKIIMPIYAGDLYFFNGKNVHAVSSPHGDSSHRTTLSCLMAFKNDNKTLLYWT